MIYLLNNDISAYATNSEGIKKLVLKHSDAYDCASAYVDFKKKVAVLKLQDPFGPSCSCKTFHITEVPSV